MVNSIFSKYIMPVLSNKMFHGKYNFLSIQNISNLKGCREKSGNDEVVM